MPQKRYRPGEIIAWLREADVVSAIGVSGCATEATKATISGPCPFM